MKYLSVIKRKGKWKTHFLANAIAIRGLIIVRLIWSTYEERENEDLVSDSDTTNGRMSPSRLDGRLQEVEEKVWIWISLQQTRTSMLPTSSVHAMQYLPACVSTTTSSSKTMLSACQVSQWFSVGCTVWPQILQELFNDPYIFLLQKRYHKCLKPFFISLLLLVVAYFWLINVMLWTWNRPQPCCTGGYQSSYGGYGYGKKKWHIVTLNFLS